MDEQKPVLLITCRAGNEDWCVEEIGNVLFPEDPRISIVKTRYPGLIIVYSNLDPVHAYSIASRSEYGFVEKIIPIYIYEELESFEPKKVLNLVSRGEKVKFKLRVRGVRGLSMKLWSEIINVLRSKNVYHDPRSKTCLYVEVVDNHVYAGKAEC